MTTKLFVQGIEALAALSYVLRIDGQDALAKKFDLMNSDFIKYWMQNAFVSK